MQKTGLDARVFTEDGRAPWARGHHPSGSPGEQATMASLTSSHLNNWPLLMFSISESPSERGNECRKPCCSGYL
jgi:hypothetical protein